MCLTFHLFLFAVFFKNFQRLELVYVLSSILIPLLHGWIPFIHNSYGMSGAWCWIRGWEDDCMTKKYEEGIIEVFALWYGPVIIALALNSLGIVVIIITMLCRAYQQVKSESDKLLSREKEQKRKALRQLLPLLAYPVLFFLLMLIPFAHRIYDAAAHGISYPLTLAHAVANPCWGLLSGLALIAHIFSVYYHKIGCTCCKKIRNYHNLDHLAAHTQTAQYNSYHTVASTTTGTAFFVPPESEVDNHYLNI